MNNKLYEIAREETSISEVMIDHENVKMVDLITAYPNGVHVDKVDVIDSEKGEYVVFNFVENPKYFCNGGMIMSKIVKAWLKEYNGDLTEVNKLLEEKPLLFRFVRDVTKKGNTITLVNIIKE